MWRWRRMVNSWTDRVRNEDVLYRVKDRNIIHTRTIKRRKANSIGHIWRRNCLLKHVLEGRIERTHMTGRRGRRHEQLLDDLKEPR